MKNVLLLAKMYISGKPGDVANLTAGRMKSGENRPIDEENCVTVAATFECYYNSSR